MSRLLEQYVLTSDRMSVAVAPALGGRITEIIDLSARRQWLWRNRSVPLGPVSPESAYDDVWQGGFEELFPNDAPTEMNGIDYPDHGELWSIPWHVKEESEDSLTLNVVGPITGTAVTKKFTLRGFELLLQYALTNPGESPLYHLFKLHPAIAIDEHCHIDLPGGFVEKVQADFGNLLGINESQRWPTTADLSRCRASASATNEFVYVSDVGDGYCGITDQRTGSWFRIDYPLEVFPFCWIFLTYGGWRDHNVVVLEPCTNYPKDLHEAIARGNSAVLMPGETKEFEVVVSVGDRHE